MATIYDHRPRTAGAGGAISPWAGIGEAAEAFVGAKQGAERQQAELKRAAALEEEYQSRARVRDQQLKLQQSAVDEQNATQQALREGIQAGGGRYDDIVGRLSVEQKAGMDRWLQNPDVSPELIQKQLDEWGAQFDLQDLMEEAETLERYAAGIGADPETGEEGPQMEAAQGILEAFKAGEMEFSQAATELNEMGRRLHVEQRAGAQRVASIEKAEEMILRYKPESTGLDEQEENYDEMVDILAQISNGVTMVKSADKDKGMVPKGYNALLGELEVLLNPNLVAAVEARQARRQAEQIEMEIGSPIVYEMITRTGSPAKQRDFVEAKQAFDLGGVQGLRRHVGLPPGEDPARGQEPPVGDGGQLNRPARAGGSGYVPPTAWADRQDDVPPPARAGVRGYVPPPARLDIRDDPGGEMGADAAIDIKADDARRAELEQFRRPAPAGKPKKLSALKGEARATALQTAFGLFRQIDPSGMSKKDYLAEVKKLAAQAGIIGSFDEIMQAIQAEGAGGPKKKPGSQGYSESGLMEIGIQ